MASHSDTFPTASSNASDEHLYTSRLPVTPPGNYINVDNLGNNTDTFGSALGAPDRRVFLSDASLSPEIVYSIDLEDPFFVVDRSASNSSVPSKVASNAELADPFFVVEYSARNNSELIMSFEEVAGRPAERNIGPLSYKENTFSETVGTSGEPIIPSPDKIPSKRIVYDIDTLIKLRKYAKTSLEELRIHDGAFSGGIFREAALPNPVEQVWTPHRQPIQPGSKRAQMESNFFKFLKRHTSPPHNRVTAGGRIVPAGPRIPPPTFNMDIIDGLLKEADERTKQEEGLKEHEMQTNLWGDNVEIPKPNLQRLQDAQLGNLENIPHNGQAQAKWPELPRNQRRGINSSYNEPRLEVHKSRRSSTQASAAHTLSNRAFLPPIISTEVPSAQAAPTLLPAAQGPSVMPSSSAPVPLDETHLLQPSSDIPLRPMLFIPPEAELVMMSDRYNAVVQFRGFFFRAILDGNRTLFHPMTPHLMPSTPGVPQPFPNVPLESYHQVPIEQHIYDQNAGPSMQYNSLPQHANNGMGFQRYQGSHSASLASNIENGFFETQYQSDPATQIHDLSNVQNVLKVDLRKLEKQIAAESHAMTSEQLSVLTTRKRSIIEELDRIRKAKKQIEDGIKETVAKKATELVGSLAGGLSENTTSHNRRSAAIPGNLTTGHRIVTHDMTGLNAGRKPLSPDAPTFIPSRLPLTELPRNDRHNNMLPVFSRKPENTNARVPRSSSYGGPTDLVTDYAEPSKPKVLAVDAAYCDEMGFNDPKAPKQYCSTPKEFSEVIEAARCCAKHYGCKGGQSKDPEYDAELDIRDVMQQKLPIPLKRPGPPGDPCKPWDFQASCFNVYSYNSRDWEAPRHTRQPGEIQMPPENMSVPKCLHVLHTNPFFIGWKDPCPLCEADRKQMIIENGRYYWVHHINGSTWVLENDQIVPCEAIGNPEPLEGAWRSRSGSWKLPAKYQALDKKFEARNPGRPETAKVPPTTTQHLNSMGSSARSVRSSDRKQASSDLRFQFLESRQQGSSSGIPRLGGLPLTIKIVPRSMKSSPSDPSSVVFNIGGANLSALPGTPEHNYWSALSEGARLLKEKARRERGQGLASPRLASRLRSNVPPDWTSVRIEHHPDWARACAMIERNPELYEGRGNGRQQELSIRGGGPSSIWGRNGP